MVEVDLQDFAQLSVIDTSFKSMVEVDLQDFAQLSVIDLMHYL